MAMCTMAVRVAITNGAGLKSMFNSFNASSAEGPHRQSGHKSGRAMVLIVDDERHIVDLLDDLFRDEGYQVRRAYDGLAALAAIDREMPDLVIADVMMPRLDGLALYNRIRERSRELPVILMSAAVTPRSIDAEFVPKPFDIEMLLDVVECKLGAP